MNHLDTDNVIHSSFNIEINREKHIAYFIYRRIPHGKRIDNNILDKLIIYEFLYETSVVHKTNFSELILKVNLEQVLSLISSGNPVPGIKILVEILRFIRIDIREHSHYQKNIVNNALKPVVYNIKNDNKKKYESEEYNDDYNFFNKESKPYQFQKLNIEWMIQKELNILSKQEHRNSEKLFYHDDEWFVYHPLSISININDANIYLGEPMIKNIQVLGGCLIDDINLGKTICGIGLILKDRHSSIINKDLLKQCDCVDNNEQNRSICKKNVNGILIPRHIPINGTLVITSKKSINKWKLELEKKVVSRYLPNFLILTTKHNFETTEYRNFIDAKIVLVSYDLIFSKNYRNIFNKFANLTYFDTDNLPDFNHLVDTYCSYLVNRLDLEQSTIDSGLVLQLFKWNRIIFDDVHEMINSKLHITHMKMLKSFDSNFKWCFSGVPFINNFTNYIDYLHLVTNISDTNSIMKCYDLNLALANNIFRRNTVQSISQEYIFPEIYEKVVYIQMDPLPRLIYNNLNHFTSIENIGNTENIKLKLKFCSNIFLLGEIGNLARNTCDYREIKKTLIERTKKLIEEHKFQKQLLINKLENQKAKLKYFESIKHNASENDKRIIREDSHKSIYSENEYEYESENEYESEGEEELSGSMLIFRNELEEGIKRTEKKLDNLEKEIVKLNNQNYIGKIRANDVCSICENKRESVLSCGHSVCLTCIINYYHFGEKFKCPVCRRPLFFEDIFVIGNPQVYYKKIRNLFKILKSVYKGKKENENETNNENTETDYLCDLLLVSEYKENFEIVRDELELNKNNELTVCITHDKTNKKSLIVKKPKVSLELLINSEVSSDNEDDCDHNNLQLLHSNNIKNVNNSSLEKEMTVKFNFTNHNFFQKALDEKKYDAIVFLDLPIDLSQLSSNNNFIKKYYHIGDETDGIQIYYLIYKNTVEETIWKEYS